MLKVESQSKIKFAPTASPLGLLQRKCACGQHTVAGGECEECRKHQRSAFMRADLLSISDSALPPALTTGKLAQPRTGHDFSHVATHYQKGPSGYPTKALTRSPKRDEEKPPPTNGDATIECDGSGGYQIAYNGWAGAACGTKSCVTAHESSHMADWQAKWPDGCKGKARGYLPKGDPPDNPLMSVSQYKSFLKESECKAHTVDLACAKALPKTKGCEKTIEDYIELTDSQRSEWCGLPRWAKVLIGVGGGAALGAVIGGLAGGGVGAAIGAGIGAVVGLIGGLLA